MTPQQKAAHERMMSSLPIREHIKMFHVDQRHHPKPTKTGRRAKAWGRGDVGMSIKKIPQFSKQRSL